MANPMVAALIEEKVRQVAEIMEQQVDDELHRLETMTEDDLENVRRKRLEQMRRAAHKKQEWLARGHGQYVDIPGEKEFFAEMKGEERLVCHFYRTSNWPCKVMDKHLQELCQLHLETKFVRIDAEKSPFLTERLKIWMLPTLALVKNEKVLDYVVGFDDLGGKDDFTTEQLRMRLAAAGVINYDGSGAAAAAKAKAAPPKALRSSRDDGDEDSDFE